MERENRKRNKKSSKTVWYLTGTVIGLAIIAFIITFTVYSNKIEEQIKQSQLDNKKISEIVQESESQSASTQMGKTVEESAQNQTSVVTNEANNTTTTTTNTTNSTGTKTNTKSNSTSNKTNTNTVNTNATNTTKTETTEKTSENNTTSEASSITDTTTSTDDVKFIKPVEGDVLKGFAKDTLIYSETLGEWTTHLGMDIKAEKTAVVKASADGKVKSIKNDPRYGLSIIIEHSNGYETLYSNLLSAEFVSVGEEVKQGQSIGTVGNTATFEIADETHLHFEISKDGVQQDPSLLF